MYTNLNRKGWGYVSEDKMHPVGKGTDGKKMPGGGPKTKNMKKTLGTLLRYLGKYKLFLVIVLVLVVFNSFAMVAGSYFLKPLVNNYILPGDFVGLAKMLVILGAIFLGGACSAYGYGRIMVHVSQNTIRDIRRDLFNKMQDLPIKYFDRNTHGDLMSLYTNDIDNIGEAFTVVDNNEIEIINENGKTSVKMNIGDITEKGLLNHSILKLTKMLQKDGIIQMKVLN